MPCEAAMAASDASLVTVDVGDAPPAHPTREADLVVLAAAAPEAVTSSVSRKRQGNVLVQGGGLGARPAAGAASKAGRAAAAASVTTPADGDTPAPKKRRVATIKRKKTAPTKGKRAAATAAAPAPADAPPLSSGGCSAPQVFDGKPARYARRSYFIICCRMGCAVNLV